MAYTPGPWKIKMQDNYMRLYMPGPLKEDVARGYVGEDNARLIAAAPELLETLEICREAITRLDEDGLGMYMREDGHGGIDYWPYTVELLQRIDTVIARAKGEVASDG